MNRDSSLPLSLTRKSLSRRTVLKGSAAAAASLSLGSFLASNHSAMAADAKLRFMNWDTDQQEIYDKAIKAFKEKNAGVDVELMLVPDENGSYQTKLNTMLAANDLPDVFEINEAQAMEWGEQDDIVMDLSPYEDQYSNVLPGAKYYSANGKFISPMTGLETIILFANKQLFEEASVPLPPSKAEEAFTWDAFVETAKLMTKDRSGKNATEADFNPDEIQQYGITYPKWWLGWYPLLRGNGGDITNEDGTKYILNSPESVEIFQKLQDLIYVHHVSPTPTSSESLPASAAQLATRRVAMAIDGQWVLPAMKQNRVPLSVGVLPKFKEYTTCLVGATVVVNAKTKNKDQALAFHQFFNLPESTFDLFAGGLWMPTDKRYLEQDDLVKSWIDNDIHPPEYRDAAILPVLNNAVVGPITIKGFAGIRPRIESALDQIWNNSKPIQQVLDEIGQEVEPMLTGRYPVA